LCPPRTCAGAGIQAKPSAIVRGRRPGAREVKASLAKRKVSLANWKISLANWKISLANWKISLAKGFRFRMRSAKPLKTFCFLKVMKFFEFAASNVIKGLRPILFRAFFSMTFSRRWAELCHCFSFYEQFTLP
jgi:hypothetical protein